MIPDLGDNIEPFLRQGITIAVLFRQIDAKRIVFRLVPSRYDIQAQPSAPQLISRSQLLGRHHRVDECSVYRRENIDAFRVRQKTGRPRQRFQHAAVEIGFTSVADPSGDRQEKLDARFIGQLCQSDIVLPGVHPSFRNLGYRHSA